MTQPIKRTRFDRIMAALFVAFIITSIFMGIGILEVAAFIASKVWG